MGIGISKKAGNELGVGDSGLSTRGKVACATTLTDAIDVVGSAGPVDLSLYSEDSLISLLDTEEPRLWSLGD